jgi:hypothetical protein
MDISVFATPPPAADTDPGDLYCDLQSRTLWLGVEEAVDPAGAVLISDIVALQAAIDAAETDANNYTNTQVALRAPLASPVFTGDPRAPTPAAADNDTSIATTAWVRTFVGAGSSSQFVTGMIMMWSGALTGVPAGWKLCDGTSGTPNLSNRFIFGASVGGKAVGAVNPNTSVDTDLKGAFTPEITGYALTVANLPAHSHTFSDSFTTGAESANHTHSFSDTSSSAGAHAHTSSSGHPFVVEVGGGGGQGTSGSGFSTVGATNTTGAHTHTVSGTTGYRSDAHTHSGSISGTTSNAGSGTSHTHGAKAVASHFHTITSLNMREAMPYYALAFIMKT